MNKTHSERMKITCICGVCVLNFTGPDTVCPCQRVKMYSSPQLQYTVPLWILFIVKEANDVNVESNALAWDIACGRAISIPSRSSPSSPVFNFHTWLQKIFSERRLVLRLCQISFSQIGTFPINNLVNMEQSPRSYLGYILYLPT